MRQIPLFSDLSDNQYELIKERSDIIEYNKHEIIYEEGSAASGFYCIICGRVIVFSRDKHGNEVILEYLHRGKYFGIISLLTNTNHSVTARALNDLVLLFIKKDDFDFILKKIPVLAVDLSRTLSRRLKDKGLHRKLIFESTIISAYSSSSQSGKTIYSLNLSLRLNQETGKTVIILDICPQETVHSLPQRLGMNEKYKVFSLSESVGDTLSGRGPEEPAGFRDFIVETGFGISLMCIHYEEKSRLKKILDILSFLVNDYHYIILDLPSIMDPFVFGILNQSDFIHLLTSPQEVDLKKTRHLIDRLKQEFNFQEAKIKVIINEYKLSKIDYSAQRGLLGHQIYATLPRINLSCSDKPVIDEVQSEYAKAIRRISRQVSENLVGVALGVGVGYGFCHIGVLKVIEEEKIPVDIIAGSSIGAIIASLWAIGRTADEILEITKEEFRQPKYTWGLVDLTFPLIGFIKGNKLYRFLKKYLANTTFYDVRLPLKIIASDIRRKESIIFDKGRLLDAVMASCSMPGVFRPFRMKQNLMLDGGIINPLPTEVLFGLGVKKIIAVNVTPTREDILRQCQEIKQEIAVTQQTLKKRRRWFNLRSYIQNKFKNNILDIVFSSIELMQGEVISKEGQLADIVLHPDTRGLHWLELYRSAEFAKRGEEETRKHLAKIWEIVKE